MASHQNKVYSYYVIFNIVFYWLMLILLPVLLVISYAIDLHLLYKTNDIILVSLGLVVLVTMIGTIYMLIKRGKLKRIVKTHYQKEFVFLSFMNVLSILGFVVLYDYLGGDRNYIANILVIISAFLFVLLMYTGKRYFKIDYISR